MATAYDLAAATSDAAAMVSLPLQILLEGNGCRQRRSRPRFHEPPPAPSCTSASVTADRRSGRPVQLALRKSPDVGRLATRMASRRPPFRGAVVPSPDRGAHPEPSTYGHGMRRRREKTQSSRRGANSPVFGGRRIEEDTRAPRAESRLTTACRTRRAGSMPPPRCPGKRAEDQGPELQQPLPRELERQLHLPADCHLSSGSGAMQVFTTRSSAVAQPLASRAVPVTIS
jgi:hypothetical protein